jgi:phage anti-repressor protein
MPVKTTYNKFFKRNISMNEGFIAGYDYDKMLAHVAEHRAADHYIPLDVDKQLIEDRNNATDK